MSGKGRPIAVGLAIVLVVVLAIVGLGRAGGSGTDSRIALRHHQGPYTISLTIQPAQIGQNTFTVGLRRGSHSITPSSVRVLVTMLDMSMPQQVVVLHKKRPGVFSGTEDLGMGGRWQFELLLNHLPGNSSMTTSVFRATVGGTG